MCGRRWDGSLRGPRFGAGLTISLTTHGRGWDGSLRGPWLGARLKNIPIFIGMVTPPAESCKSPKVQARSGGRGNCDGADVGGSAATARPLARGAARFALVDAPHPTSNPDHEPGKTALQTCVPVSPHLGGVSLDVSRQA